MLDSTVDLACMITVFSMLMCIAAVAVALFVKIDDQPANPQDVIEGMVLDMICDCNLAPITENRLSSYFNDPIPLGPREKPKQTPCDRERARQCVEDN